MRERGGGEERGREKGEREGDDGGGGKEGKR